MQPTRRAFIAAAATGLIALPSLVSAQREHREEHRDAERWERLGERTVGKKEEHDSIELKNKERYTAIWFEVDRGEIELDDIRVTFGNKESFEPKVHLVFHEGQKTKLIDLPGADREITKIEFHYRSVGHGEAAIVAWGRRK